MKEECVEEIGWFKVLYNEGCGREKVGWFKRLCFIRARDQGTGGGEGTNGA
jgi:hypothetical protein